MPQRKTATGSRAADLPPARCARRFLPAGVREFQLTVRVDGRRRWRHVLAGPQSPDQRGHSASSHELAAPRNTRIHAGEVGPPLSRPVFTAVTAGWQRLLGDSHGDSALPARDRWKRHHPSQRGDPWPPVKETYRENNETRKDPIAGVSHRIRHLAARRGLGTIRRRRRD